jgi:hypothetical protein
MICLEVQHVGEISSRRVQFERRNRVVGHLRAAAHLPGIDPGMKRHGLCTGLPNAASGEGFAEAMGVGARDRRMPHPDLLIGPSCLLRTGRHRLTEQCPLHAIAGSRCIRKISRHVPPLDAKFRMRAVVGGKDKFLTRNHRRKALAVHAKPGKSLRPRSLLRQRQKQRAAGKGSA